MFKRYTEKSRRAIFFARYDARNYGSPYIETEHLLLGLLREDRTLEKWFPQVSHIQTSIRSEIEKHITPSGRISTSVEGPFITECKKILNLAAETADSLAQRQIEPQHLLIAILGLEKSLVAQILIVMGLKPEPILECLANARGNQNVEQRAHY